MTKAVTRETVNDMDNTDTRYILYLATIITYFGVSNPNNDAPILSNTTTNRVTASPEIAFFMSSLLNAICDAVAIANSRNIQKLGESKLPLLNIPL
jgi:hypothetical protein